MTQLDSRRRGQFEKLRSQQAGGGQLNQRQQQRFSQLSQQRAAPPPPPPPPPPPQNRGGMVGPAMDQLNQWNKFDGRNGYVPPPGNFTGQAPEGMNPFTNMGNAAGEYASNMAGQPGGIDPNRIPPGYQQGNTGGGYGQPYGDNNPAFQPTQRPVYRTAPAYGQGSGGEPGSQWRIGMNNARSNAKSLADAYRGNPRPNMSSAMGSYGTWGMKR